MTPFPSPLLLPRAPHGGAPLRGTAMPAPAVPQAAAVLARGHFTCDASLQALAIFREESQAAVIGLKTPQDAAAAMQRRIEPLVKKK